MDFFSLQVVTGRDVRPTLFANWFTGGLSGYWIVWRGLDVWLIFTS